MENDDGERKAEKKKCQATSFPEGKFMTVRASYL